MNILSPLGFLWNTFFYHPVVNCILVIYKYFGHNLGVSIILLTIIIRVILWPFMKSQINAMKNMQDLKPKLDKLKEQYKDDKRKYQEEQLKLYRESGVNPAGSCLPLIVQLPFIYAVYNVIRAAATSSSASVFNKIVYLPSLRLPIHEKFNTSFLGMNLAKDAGKVGFHHFSVVLPYIILALLVGITQYFASKVSLPENIEETTEAIEIIEEPKATTSKKKQKAAKKAVAVANTVPAKKDEKGSADTLDPEQFSKTLSTQMLYIFPLILTWISLGFAGSIPAGLSLYWVVQSLLIVIQTLILQKKSLWKILPTIKK